MTLEQIALAGGLYVPLVFWHFVADWLTQTQDKAERKSKDHAVLASHCLVYTLFFVPVLLLYQIPMWGRLALLPILFISHLIGDAGFPVWFWARYIRRMTYPNNTKRVIHQMDEIFPPMSGLSTRLLFRPSLVLVIDQLWHLAWLWPIVYLALVNHA